MVTSGAAERFNCWSHGLGALLALAGLVALLARAAGGHDGLKLASLVVYGTSLVLLYSASAGYHALQGRAKTVFRKLDHLAIYLLIAGSYTPFGLVTLRDSAGPALLAAVWGLALLGCLLEFWTHRPGLAVGLYLGMGWLALLAIRPLAQALAGPGMTWLVVGGLCYTLGTAFFALDRRYPAAHGVFHVLVMGGSVSHFVAVWAYVA